MIHPTAKVSEEVNRKSPPSNMTVQLLPPYTTLSATIDTVTDRQTDSQQTITAV